MKAEDILKEEAIPEEKCGVCLLHKKAEEKLGNNIECPHCKKYIPIEKIEYNLDTAIVGETNYYTKEQNVEKMFIANSPLCDEPIGFKAIPIGYNANHDIYYTCGKDYLINQKIEVGQKIREKTQEYTERLKAGENLEAIHLETWIKYELEHIVAQILYEHGLKY